MMFLNFSTIVPHAKCLSLKKQMAQKSRKIKFRSNEHILQLITSHSKAASLLAGGS